MPRPRRRTLTLFVLLILCWPTLVRAQDIKAGVVTLLQGSVTAARAALPQPVALRFKDDVFLNDRIVSGDRSIARLLLGGKAVVTVRERSVLKITEVPGRSTIDLDTGKIAVAVARGKMRPGETIAVKTANAVATVRGTVFVAEVTHAIAALDAAQVGPTSSFYGFSGEVRVTIANQVFTLLPNMLLQATGSGLATLEAMTPGLREQALVGLQTPTQQVSAGQASAKDQAVGSTVATFRDGLPDVAPPPLTSLAAPTAQPPVLPGGTSRLDLSGLGLGGVCPAPCAFPGAVITPDSIVRPPPFNSQAFGLLHPNGLVTDQYKGLGVIFGPARVAIVTDAANVWAGVNANNVVDLISPVEAAFVAPGTTVPVKTNHLSVEVGLAAVGSLLLEAFDSAGVLIGSTPNGSTLGPHGRTLATLDIPGIHAFRVSGLDTWGMDQIEFGDLIDPPQVVTLNGPLLRGTHEQRTAFSAFLDMIATVVVGQSTDPLVWLSGSTFTTAHSFALLSNADVTSRGTWLRLDDGSTIIQTGAGDPLVAMRGGSLTVGNGSAGGDLFELIGRPAAVQADPVTGLTLGTDRPLQPGAESPVFEADTGATVNVRGRAYRVDAALLAATAPLLNLRSGGSLTTGSHTVDLAGRARIDIPNDAVSMISLTASTLTVTNGHLVNLAGGSALTVAGSLVSLANGSTLNLLNGLLLNVSDGSVATIGRSLVSFSGSGNVLNVTNTLAPTALVGGIPVHGPPDRVRVTSPAALVGVGTAGTIRINGVALTPTTPLGSLSGSLIAVGSNGSVRIGP